MTGRADTAIRARVVEAVTMAAHAGHRTFVDVCDKQFVLVAGAIGRQHAAPHT